MKKTPVLTVEVTQAHIDKATKERIKNKFDYRNPIEVAMMEKLHRDVYVNESEIQYVTSQSRRRYFDIPPIVSKFLDRFDEKKTVKPFSFTLYKQNEIVYF